MIYFMSSSRLAFRYFGIFAGVMGLIYFLINKLWLETAIRRRNELGKVTILKKKNLFLLKETINYVIFLNCFYTTENNQDIDNEDQHEQKINMLPVKQPGDSHENA